MEPVRRRGMDAEFDRQTDQILSNKSMPVKDENRKLVDHKNELFLAACLPFTILIIFGGRPCLLTLTFGGLICYIFDLMGSVEVGFMQHIVNSK